MKLSEHLRISRRAVKYLYTLSPVFLVCQILTPALGALIPYVPVYFSARLIDALLAGADLSEILLYVALTVGLVFLLNLAVTGLESRKGTAWREMDRNLDWAYSEKAMVMAYESIENPEIARLREQIRFESQTGYNLFYLYECIEDIIRKLTSVIAAFALTVSFFQIQTIPLWLKLLFVLGIALTVAVIVLTKKKVSHMVADFSNGIPKINLYAARFGQYLGDYSSGQDIRLYDMGEGLATSYFNILQEFSRRYNQLLLRLFRGDAARTVMTHLLKFGAYGLLIYGAILGGVTIGSIARYVSCLMLMLDAVSELFNDVHMVLMNHTYLKRFFSYFDIPNRMYQGTLTVEKRDDNDYQVEFRDVSFKYPNTDAWALRHVNLKFNIGEKLAVVGMNGSGKTTFIKLLCRLYDPTEGEIRLNGVDIRKYDYDEYLSIFSVVFQDFQLFAFSLGENVAANSNYDPERVKLCLEKAGFGAEKLPLETCLYKNFDAKGVEISGGEAQKIALARALYKNAPFIILDEPTSALDPVSEYEVYSRFNRIAGDRTAVYISHRLASCRFCDKIAVFHEGTVIQQGSHESLLADQSGKYFELWQAQAQYYQA